MVSISIEEINDELTEYDLMNLGALTSYIDFLNRNDNRSPIEIMIDNATGYERLDYKWCMSFLRPMYKDMGGVPKHIKDLLRICFSEMKKNKESEKSLENR